MNPGPEYLGAGRAELPTTYGVMAVAFAVAATYWVALLYEHRASYVSCERSRRARVQGYLEEGRREWGGQRGRR